MNRSDRVVNRLRSVTPSVFSGVLAACLLGVVLGSGPAEATTSYTLYTFDNPADPNFNQLLGINNAQIMVGYDGDGTVLPNKGYLLVPIAHYSAENFPGSAQTQVIGINNHPFPASVGFYVDAQGNNFGFINDHGINHSVAFPGTPASGGIKTNQLLGINDNSVAAGFYLDAAGNSHAYVYDATSATFQALTLPFKNVVSSLATGINNAGIICGSYTDTTTTHGFYGKPGNFVSVDVPKATSTTFFGLNNKGFIVGFATVNGVSTGVIYDTATKTNQTFNAPLQSATTAFGVNGTTINGINDLNDVVGFYSDGTKVHGFLARP